ncbi:hypothetical protein GCM10022225_80330 [Plantactinospora mayteni]|uniref:Uncharacterized protein n=1 Tax=Plantactinospora mayteni TaxID=566021 RepID=A0ABQ4F3E0_9ACTN|nr:hypothetical protein [Plantactinospora mayteni]GIH01382.1 hypothetical protein Pma05_79540 [Plantactinospora mayteni]
MVRLDMLAGEHTGARQKIDLSPTPDWARYGVGVADMTREPDGFWRLPSRPGCCPSIPARPTFGGDQGW